MRFPTPRPVTPSPLLFPPAPLGSPPPRAGAMPFPADAPGALDDRIALGRHWRDLIATGRIGTAAPAPPAPPPGRELGLASLARALGGRDGGR